MIRWTRASTSRKQESLHDSAAACLQRCDPDNGVLTLSGYGLRIAVERGHLMVEDGVGSARGLGASVASTEAQRLVIIGQSGSITLDAIAWLHRVGITLVHIGAMAGCST